MTPGGWRGCALAVCLALGLWACQPASLSPIAIPTDTRLAPAMVAESPTTLPPISPTKPALPTPTPLLITPTLPPAAPDVTETPPTTVADSLVAQYDPWSLGHAVAWSPGGDMLAVSAGEAVYFYASDTLQAQGHIDLASWGAGLAFSPTDPSLLAVAGRDGALQIWNITQPERLAYRVAHARGATSVSFSPDGLYLASSGNDPMVRLWHVAALLTGEDVEPLAVMIGGAVAVPAIRYSPDGSIIASIDLKNVRLRDPLTQRLVRTLRSETSMFTLAFSPDGRWLAVGELGSQVRVWDVALAEEAILLRANAADADPERAFVWSLGFSPDGNLLAAGSSAGTLTIWSLPGGEVAKVVQAHDKAVSGLAFDSQGQRVATCGLDAALRVWSVP